MIVWPSYNLQSQAIYKPLIKMLLQPEASMIISYWSIDVHLLVYLGDCLYLLGAETFCKHIEFIMCRQC